MSRLSIDPLTWAGSTRRLSRGLCRVQQLRPPGQRSLVSRPAAAAVSHAHHRDRELHAREHERMEDDQQGDGQPAAGRPQNQMAQAARIGPQDQQREDQAKADAPADAAQIKSDKTGHDGHRRGQALADSIGPETGPAK